MLGLSVRQQIPRNNLPTGVVGEDGIRMQFSDFQFSTIFITQSCLSVEKQTDLDFNNQFKVIFRIFKIKCLVSGCGYLVCFIRKLSPVEMSPSQPRFILLFVGGRHRVIARCSLP